MEVNTSQNKSVVPHALTHLLLIMSLSLLQFLVPASHLYAFHLCLVLAPFPIPVFYSVLIKAIAQPTVVANIQLT